MRFFDLQDIEKHLTSNNKITKQCLNSLHVAVGDEELKEHPHIRDLIFQVFIEQMQDREHSKIILQGLFYGVDYEIWTKEQEESIINLCLTLKTDAVIDEMPNLVSDRTILFYRNYFFKLVNEQAFFPRANAYTKDMFIFGNATLEAYFLALLQLAIKIWESPTIDPKIRDIFKVLQNTDSTNFVTYTIKQAIARNIGNKINEKFEYNVRF